MSFRTPVVRAAVLLLLAPAGVSAQAYWTDWTAAGAGYVDGTLAGLSGAIGVRYTGPYAFAQTSGGTNYWNFPIYDVAGAGTRPATSDIVALNAGGTHTIRFSAPVVDPFLAIVSMGQPGWPVSYTFTSPFTVISEGQGWWGDGSYTTSPDNKTLTGYEMHGALRFSGTFTELSWTSNPNEYWHGVTVGVAGAASVVPEPSTWALLATGLLGLGVVVRRRRPAAQA